MSAAKQAPNAANPATGYSGAAKTVDLMLGSMSVPNVCGGAWFFGSSDELTTAPVTAAAAKAISPKINRTWYLFT